MLIKKLLLVLTLAFTLLIISSCGPDNSANDIDTNMDDLIIDTSNKESNSDSDITQSSDNGNEDVKPDAEKLNTYGNFTTLHKTLSADDRVKQMQESKSVFNTGSEYTNDQLKKVKLQAIFIANPGSLFFPNAADLMEHYLEGKGEIYELDVEDLLENKIARENMYKDVNSALRAAEQIATKDEKITIYQIEENIHHNLTEDWKYAVGSYFTSVELCDVKVSTMFGVTYYSAKLKYVVQDFYNWDANDTNDVSITDVSPADLHQLHLSGEAQEFLTYGEEVYEIKWVKGIDARQIEFDD